MNGFLPSELAGHASKGICKAPREASCKLEKVQAMKCLLSSSTPSPYPSHPGVEEAQGASERNILAHAVH
jgi:hypothetical protein